MTDSLGAAEYVAGVMEDGSQDGWLASTPGNYFCGRLRSWRLQQVRPGELLVF